MPGRKKKLFKDGVYHVFNKTISPRRIFDNEYNSKLFLETAKYYRSAKSRLSFSKLDDLSPEITKNIIKEIAVKKFFRVEILAYCLMPTHYHFLIRQMEDNGISKFIGNLINSFTRHVNKKNSRLGPIFLPKFKAVPVLSDEQLMHVSRYIHLNPYSSAIIKDVMELTNYPWSSYEEYILEKKGICNIGPVIELFNNDHGRYRQFVENHAEHQLTLEYAKHAEKWI